MFVVKVQNAGIDRWVAYDDSGMCTTSRPGAFQYASRTEANVVAQQLNHLFAGLRIVAKVESTGDK